MEVCSLCGVFLDAKSFDSSACRKQNGNPRISVLDISVGGTTFLNILEQILEEEEKGIICLLNSGDICKDCADVLESIDIYLQKLRELKWDIIQKFNIRINKEDQENKEPSNKQKQGTKRTITEEQKETGKKTKKRKSSKQREGREEDVLFEISYIDQEGDAGPAGELPQTSQLSVVTEDEETSSSSCPNNGSPSPATHHDSDEMVIEETKRTFMTIMYVVISKETLELLYNIQDKTLADSWKETLLPIVEDNVKKCSLELKPAQRQGEPDSVEISGSCNKCSSRSLKVVIHPTDLRLDLEFSEGNCEVQDILDWDPGTKVLDSVTKICEYCLKEFVGDGPQQMAEIREHLTLEHSRLDDRIYTCKCGRQFNKKGARNNHYKRCEKNPCSEEPVTCELCGRSVRNIKVHLNYCKREVVCEICNKVLANGRQLEEHKFIMHEQHQMNTRVRREYPCDECDRVFTKKYNLDSHKLMHSDDKPFKCQVQDCGKSFKREVTLRQHVERIHDNNINPIYCDFCPAQIKSATGLRIHVYTKHNVGTPVPRTLKCSHCDKFFKCAADLKVHSVTHTKVKAFSCDICDQKFSRKNSLLEHMNVHAQKFRCEKCFKCFGRERYLKGHLENCTKSDPRSKEDVVGGDEEVIIPGPSFPTVQILKREDILGLGQQDKKPVVQVVSMPTPAVSLGLVQPNLIINKPISTAFKIYPTVAQTVDGQQHHHIVLHGGEETEEGRSPPPPVPNDHVPFR